MILLLGWGIFNFCFAVYSINKIKKSPQECEFIWYLGLPIGAFVWEDVLIFGIFHALLAFISYFTSNLSLWIMGFLIFWIVRSAGETLYFFLQQFIEPKHHPHEISANFKILRKLFGNISDQKCFILLQILMQCVLIVSLLLLILYLGKK